MNKLLALLLLLSSISSSARNVDSLKFAKKNSIQLEAGGHGYIYSLNYERIVFNKPKIKESIQFGITYYPKFLGFTDLWIFASSNSIRTFGNHHFEIGIGIMSTIDIPKNLNNENVHLSWSPFLTGRIGYRYQKPEGKFLFRIGFTPMMVLRDFEFLPLAAITFGKTF